MPVYHGKISRETGEKLLLATGLDGSYLLRDSESVPGVYCLCVLWVHHCCWAEGLQRVGTGSGHGWWGQAMYRWQELVPASTAHPMVSWASSGPAQVHGGPWFGLGPSLGTSLLGPPDHQKRLPRTFWGTHRENLFQWGDAAWNLPLVRERPRIQTSILTSSRGQQGGALGWWNGQIWGQQLLRREKASFQLSLKEFGGVILKEDHQIQGEKAGKETKFITWRMQY